MKLTTFKPSRMAALLCAGAMGFAVQAHALDITPATSNTPVSGNDALSADQVEFLTGYNGQLESAYKVEYDGGIESGPGEYYYSTVFTSTSADTDGPSGATISWGNNGLWIACPDCFLVVKDGKQDPSAYIFNLGSWDGQEPITLSNFWGGATSASGAISYVEIFGSTTDGGGPPLMVPEADTYAMLLAGLGLVGFAARRKLNKTA